MKNISNLLSIGNLNPKERMKLQVKNYLELEKTGVTSLSDSDMYALSDGWKPKFRFEVDEYNKYLNGAKKETQMRNEITLAFTQAQLKISRVSRVLDYAMFRGYKKKNMQESLLLDMAVPRDEAFDFIISNSGFNYEQILESEPKIRPELSTLISQGVLSVTTFEDKIIESKRTVKLITGKSILNLADDHTIKIEYLRHVEHYMYFSLVLLFIKQSDLFKLYGDLIAIRDIYIKLANIYDADLGYYLYDLIDELEESLNQMNIEILYFLSKVSDEQFNKNAHPKFSLDVHVNNVLFKSPKKDASGKLYVKYTKEFKTIFNREFDYS
jgi:hypothetical protein